MLNFRRSGTFSKDFRKWIDDYALRKRQEELLRGREPRRSHPSVRNYVSALDLILDYEYDISRRLSIRDINDDFLANLIAYATELRVSTTEHKYLTKGGMSNGTVNKRIDALFFFMESTYPGKLLVQRPKHLETLKHRVIRLDIGELRELESLEIDNPVYDRTRDYFLFLCYTGLRYSDFVKLDSSYYETDTGDLVLNTNKTSKSCRIHLNPKALAIARKYDFRFRPGCNQDLNRYIKLLLKEYHLFETEETVEYMKRTRQTRVAMKRELISCHTGRRTYISILAENGMSAYEIMSATGHTQVQTVMRYIDLFGPGRREKFAALDRLFTE